MKCGIIGLPNIGKSTLFNALISKMQAQAADYPFCTIEPNFGFSEIQDPRLVKLAKIQNSEKILFARLEIVDIAGLVKGASEGSGLGNKFLSHIRSVDLLLHVARCFDKGQDKASPIEDIETVMLELALSDIESLEKQKNKKTKNDKNKNEKALTKQEISEMIEKIENGEKVDHKELLTSKSMIYIANTPGFENEYSEMVKNYALSKNASFLWVAADIEMNALAIDNNPEILKEFDIQNSCIDKITMAAYKELGLKIFFTIGPKEARAWLVKDTATAVDCAEKIHSDIARGFIVAEVTNYKDYINNSKDNAKEQKFRLEGKKYIVEDGDILNIRFNI